MTKNYVFLKTLLVCLLVISLSSCNDAMFDFVPNESDITLMFQWGENHAETGVCFVIRDNRIFAISCDTGKHQLYDNYLNNLTIHKYMGSHKMTREEQEKVNGYLEKIELVEGDEFFGSRKGFPFLILYYNNRVLKSDIQIELYESKDELPTHKYEEGYYVLNEFTKYVCTLMPEAFDNFPK